MNDWFFLHRLLLTRSPKLKQQLSLCSSQSELPGWLFEVWYQCHENCRNLITKFQLHNCFTVSCSCSHRHYEMCLFLYLHICLHLWDEKVHSALKFSSKLSNILEKKCDHSIPVNTGICKIGPYLQENGAHRFGP